VPLDVTFKRPAIGKRRLFDPKNLARMLLDTSLKSQLTGPFVEFANGDILPGRIVAVPRSESSGYAAIGAAVLVSDPLASLDRRRSIIRVRTESIVRVVCSDRLRQTATFPPGTVVLRGGKRVTARSVAWRPDGLRMLLDNSVRTVGWDQIAEFRAPRADRGAAVLRDTLICRPQDSDFLCRMTATNGAVLTYHCRRIQNAGSRRRGLQVVQPSWALNAICIRLDNIVSESYRRTDEVPLASLPARVLAQKSMTGFNWHWRRNRGFHGQPLSTGRLQSNTGVAMHSYSEIAFELPKGAVSFSSWVGIDRATKGGGCVRCRIHLDDISSKPVWVSGIMLGSGKPLRVGIPDIRGAKRLVLVVEFAHRDRPNDADPLDIRDEVSWLWPTVTVDRSALAAVPTDLTDSFPQLAGWSISPEMRKRITVRPFYDSRRGKWTNAMVLDGDRNLGAQTPPLIVTRELNVNRSNAWLVAATGRDNSGSMGYRLRVYVGRTKIAGTEGYDSGTSGYSPGEMDTVAYGLGRYVGQKVRISVKVGPHKSTDERLCGLLWGRLTAETVIADFPVDPKSAVPDVSLGSLEPVEVDSGPDAGKPSSSNVNLRFCRMDGGLVMPPGVRSVTYKLDPKWRRFVACVGPAGSSSGGAMGAFQVLVDGNVLWTGNRFTRLSRARYIDVPLPQKAGKRLILRVDNETRSKAVWANAGFKLKGK